MCNVMENAKGTSLVLDLDSEDILFDKDSRPLAAYHESLNFVFSLSSVNRYYLDQKLG